MLFEDDGNFTTFISKGLGVKQNKKERSKNTKRGSWQSFQLFCKHSAHQKPSICRNTQDLYPKGKTLVKAIFCEKALAKNEL